MLRPGSRLEVRSCAGKVSISNDDERHRQRKAGIKFPPTELVKLTFKQRRERKLTARRSDHKLAGAAYSIPRISYSSLLPTSLS